jgi:pimeloyl-ACP methyl ester carboxylesterase
VSGGDPTRKGCSSSKAHQHSVLNVSGTSLALWHYPGAKAVPGLADPSSGHVNGRATGFPVILSHGTFSNHRSCRGLAQYLAKRGFDCWILDFQGHGQSDAPCTEPDFESMCLEDVEAALEFVYERTLNEPINWVGHSGGGLAALMYLARNLERQSRIGKLTILASQATHAGSNARNRVGIQLCRIVTRVLKVAPGRWLKIGPENEFAKVMLQWYQWSLDGRWVGADGFDYEAALQQVVLPLQCFAGAGDSFIAPVEGCRHLFDCYGGSDKTFHFCGTETGYKEDYSHARIISSGSAAKEIWPNIADWLQSG